MITRTPLPKNNQQPIQKVKNQINLKTQQTNQPNTKIQTTGTNPLPKVKPKSQRDQKISITPPLEPLLETPSHHAHNGNPYWIQFKHDDSI